jgi:hypothetical protein
MEARFVKHRAPDKRVRIFRSSNFEWTYLSKLLSQAARGHPGLKLEPRGSVDTSSKPQQVANMSGKFGRSTACAQ